MDYLTPDGPVHGFKSYDEFADHRDMPPEPRRMSARSVATIAAVIAVLACAYVALSGWLTVEIIAPTAAEVMAADFDLERKLAGVMP